MRIERHMPRALRGYNQALVVGLVAGFGLYTFSGWFREKTNVAASNVRSALGIES